MFTYMNRHEVQSYDWVVENGFAQPVGLLLVKFICFMNPGKYKGNKVEPVWQYKPDKSEWWDNLAGEPDEHIKSRYSIRLLIRAITKVTQIPEVLPNFQNRVLPWLLQTFGDKVAFNIATRNSRFLEESLELVQSTGLCAEEAHMLVDWVFNRPTGEPFQEVGGVMVTLAALCLANDLDMYENGEKELDRIWSAIDKIRNKDLMKPNYSPHEKAHSS